MYRKIVAALFFLVLVFLANGALAQEAVCGNGVVEGSEQCDTTTGNETCATKGFDTGTLLCTNCVFDTSGCRDVLPPLPPEPMDQSNTINLTLFVVVVLIILGLAGLHHSKFRKKDSEPEVPVPENKAVD